MHTPLPLTSLSYLCNPAFELSLLQVPGTSVSGVLQLQLTPLLLLSFHLHLHFFQNCLQVQQNPPVLPSLYGNTVGSNLVNQRQDELTYLKVSLFHKM